MRRSHSRQLLSPAWPSLSHQLHSAAQHCTTLLQHLNKMTQDKSVCKTTSFTPCGLLYLVTLVQTKLFVCAVLFIMCIPLVQRSFQKTLRNVRVIFEANQWHSKLFYEWKPKDEKNGDINEKIDGKIREALLKRCLLFYNIYKGGGGGQIRLQKIMLQILYSSGGLFAT